MFSYVSTLTPLHLIISLLLGYLLTMMLAWHFVNFASTLTNRNLMRQSFVVITLSVLLIIAVVKSSLALALGLVAALTIVRFRTPIREPEELLYITLCAAIGLCLGAGEWLVAVLAMPLILIFLSIAKWHQRAHRPSGCLLVITGKTDEKLQQLLSHCLQYCQRLPSSNDKQLYRIRFKQPYSACALSLQLRQHYPQLQVSFCNEA